VLALAGGALGLLVARWGYQILWDLRPPMLRTAGVHIELDARVLFFTVAVSLATGILFGLAPALRSTNPDLAVDLKERTGQLVSGAGGRRSRSVLVAAEVALCVVGMIGAGLFLRSLGNAESFDPGYDASHLATISFNVASQKYSEERGRAYQRQVVERAGAVPGVLSAALARDNFLSVTFSRTVLIEGDAEAERGRLALMSPVSANYFRTTGIALLRGRDFNTFDNPAGPPVAIVNETAAARFWPGQDPVGRRVRFRGDASAREVVGIARNANYLALGEAPQALFYTAVLQDYTSDATLIIRTAGDPDAVMAQTRRELQRLDPGIPLHGRGVRTTIRESLWAPRLSAGLLTVFGLLGMLLASLGIYGLVSYSVTLRVREIGIRVALGARPADVHLLIVRQTLTVVTAGVVAGLLISLGASRAVQSLLLVTSARDALTFVLAPSILMLVAILAAWFPALRATRIDPALALRDE
jgi:predicted permease